MRTTLVLSTLVLVLLLSLCLAQAQTVCAPVGQATYCFGPDDSTIVVMPQSPRQGVIQDQQGQFRPYMIQPTPLAPAGIQSLDLLEPLAPLPSLGLSAPMPMTVQPFGPMILGE